MFIIISDRCNVQHGQLAACAASGAACVACGGGGTRIMHSHIRISTHIPISHSLGNYCLPRFKRPFYFILCERPRAKGAWAYLIFIHCTNAYFACLSCLPIIHLHLFFTACYIFFFVFPFFRRHLHLPHRHVFIAYLKAQLIEHD